GHTPSSGWAREGGEAPCQDWDISYPYARPGRGRERPAATWSMGHRLPSSEVNGPSTTFARQRAPRGEAHSGALETGTTTLISDGSKAPRRGAGRKPVRDRRRPGVDAEFGVDAPDMVLDRLLGEEQVGGDLAVGVPAGDQRHDLELAGRQTAAGLRATVGGARGAVVGRTAVAACGRAAAVRGEAAAAHGKAAVTVGHCLAVEPSPMPVKLSYLTAESGNLSAAHETSG